MNYNNNLGYFENLDYENNLSATFSNININKNIEKILRCKKCKNIPLIRSVVQDKNNNYLILYECKCLDPKKYSKFTPSEFYNNFSLINNFHCQNCNEKENLLFSSINDDVFCQNCAKSKNINIDNFRTFDEFDNICEIHKLKFFGYEIQNKINFCNDCLNDGILEDGKLTFYDDVKFSEKEINEILEKITKIKNKIKNDEEIFQKICNKISSQNEKDEIRVYFIKNQENNKILLKIIENYLNNFFLRKIKEKLNYELILSFIAIDMNLEIKDSYNENNYEKNDYIKYLNNNVIIKPNELFNFLERDQYKNYEEKENNYNKIINSDEYKYLCINNQEEISSLGDYTRLKLITNEDKKLVSEIILLHDSRYAIAIDKIVDIVNSQTFNIEITLKGHSHPIFSIIQLKENAHRIVTASLDKTIKIWRIEGKVFQNEGTLNAHSNFIFKIIQFNNDFLVSSSLSEIILWKNNFPYTNLQTIKNETKEIFSLCESNRFLFCASEFKNLCCYKLTNEKLTLLNSFNNIKVCAQNDIININENLIAIGFKDKITLFNTNSLKIYKIISVSSEKLQIFSLCYLKDNRILVGMKKCIKEFNMDNCEELGSIEFEGGEDVISFNKLDDDKFSTCMLKQSIGCIWGRK
jgi:WD40 repeat protein